MNQGLVNRKVEEFRTILDTEFCQKCIDPDLCKKGFYCCVQQMKDVCPVEIEKYYAKSESN